MDQPDNNGMTPEEEALWREAQLRDAENAFIGMRSRSFGAGVGGHFIPEVKGINPLAPNWGPHEQQLIEAATSTAIVSSNPEIATGVDIEPVPFSEPEPGSNLQPIEPAGISFEQQPVLREPVPSSPVEPPSLAMDIPLMKRPFAEIASPGPSSVQVQVTEVSREQPVVLQRPMAPQAAPPQEQAQEAAPAQGPVIGAGRPPVDDQERQRLVQEAKAAIERTREERRQARQAPAAAAQAEKPQQEANLLSASYQQNKSGVGTGAGPSLYGAQPADFGTVGSTSYADPTASQIALLNTASEAVESTNLIVDAMVELLRKLVANMMKHEEVLKDLSDKADIEDAADEF